MEYEATHSLLVNRLNSSRLCVYGDRPVDGSIVVSVRFALHDHRWQRWTVKKTGEEKDGWYVVHIEISDGTTTYRLDSGDAPKITSEVHVRIKKADGSDRQKWCVRQDSRGAELMNFGPYLNPKAGLSLRGDFGNVQYDNVVLDRYHSATSQLWYHTDYAPYKEDIPH